MAIAKAAMCSVQEDLIDFNSSRHCRGAEDDGFTRNLSEDYHVGEGESDGTLGSIGLLNGSLPEEQDDDQFTEERLVETIFSNCESSKSGLLSTERLIAFIKGKVHEKEYVRLSPFVEDLQHMIDPLNLNLDVDKKTFRCVMRDWIVKLQNGNEIYNSLPNHSVSEPVLRTMLPLSASSPLPKKSFVSGNQSSLGLLDISSMSTYSCGSFEGCGGGSLNIDSVDLMDQVTELKFRNKRLEDELTELRTLLNHTEELHANVLTECEMLKKKLYSTQLTAEKSRQLEKESEDLKDSLTTCEGTCHTLRAKIQQLEKENMGLSNKIGELNDEVNQSNSNLEAMKKKERELIDSLTIHKAEIEYWKEQTNIHIVAYNHKERKLNDVKLLVDELSNSLEQAKKEKLDLEIQLSATQDELLSIRSQCSLLQVSKDSMNFPTEMNGTSDTNEEDRSDNESFCFSSPFIKNCGSQRSIQAEIQALGVLDESAPSPFCGKKNSREGASRALFNTDVSAFLEQVVHEKADLRQKHIRKLHSLATLQKNEANREGETPHNEHKTCEIQLTEKELTFVINLLEGVEDGDERLRDLLKKTTSFNIQDMEDNLKSESEASLDGAKDLPSEHAKVKELEQEVEEQRLKIEDLQTQLENNEKEYETSKQANMTLGGLLRNTTNCISFFTRQLSATVAVAEKCGLGEEKMTHLGADFAVKSSTGQVITGQEESENLTKGAEDGWSQIQIDLNGSDGSCAGSQKEGSVYMSPDRLKFQVNRELNALKNQIAKSQAVLAALARSSDLLAGSKGSTEQAQGAGDTVDEVESRESESPRVGHRECARDNQQQSLESVPVGVLNSSKSGREHQLTKSCPAIVSHISTGTQTDVNELLRQKAGSADDVKNDEEPSPQRFRSSSFIAAIEKSKPEKQRIQDCIEEEEEFKEAEEQPIRMFEPRLDGLDLDDYRSADTTDKPSADQQRTNLAADADRTQDQAQDDSNDEAFASPTASSPDRGDWSGGQRVHPRLRQRSIPGSPVAAIQRSAAIDYDEAEDDSNSASETVSGNTKKAELEKTEGNGSQKDVEDPPLPDKNQKAFPSLPDSFLKKLGLHRDSKPCDALSEQDIETKFTSLSLAFKTDKITLENRLELQQRQRDLSEKNMDAEINQLKSALNDLNHLCINVETSELLNKIQRQVDVLQQSTERVSSSAEMFGAVQQENRVSRAIEIMLLHVENLKRLYEKEHQELEDARRFLAENNLIQEENVDHGDEAQLRTSRYRSLQSLVGATKLSASGSKRRFSIGALPRSPAGPEGYRTGFNSGFGEGKSKVVGMIRVGSYNHLSRRPSLAPTMKLALCQSDVYSSSSDSVEKPEFTGKSDLCSGMDNIKEIAENVKEGSDKGSDNGSDAVEENNNCKMENICNHKNNYEEYESNFRFESESSDFENEDNLENEDEILLREKCDAENYASLLQKQRTFRDQVLHYSVKARTVVANLSWPWGFEQTLLHIRYCITGLLLFAALLSLVSTFVPTSAEERQTQPISWTDLNELFGPHLSLRHVGPQPY